MNSLRQWPTRKDNSNRLKDYTIEVSPLNMGNKDGVKNSIIQALKTPNNDVEITSTKNGFQITKQVQQVDVNGYPKSQNIIFYPNDENPRFADIHPLFVQAVAQFVVFGLNQFIVDFSLVSKKICEEQLCDAEEILQNPSLHPYRHIITDKKQIHDLFTEVVQVLATETGDNKVFQEWRLKLQKQSLDSEIVDYIPIFFTRGTDTTSQEIHVAIDGDMDLNDVVIFNANMASAIFDAMTNPEMSLLLGLPNLLSTYLNVRNNGPPSKIKVPQVRGVIGMSVSVNPR